MSDRIKPRKSLFVVYLLPAVLFYTFTVVVPVFYAVFYSAFKWKGGPKKTFIGFDNYVNLLQDDVFWKAFGNNIFLCVVCIIGQIGIAFIFASLLNSQLVKIKSVHRVLCYFPVTLSAVVIGFIWSMIYDYNFGLLNRFLEMMGMPELKQAWLSNQDWAMTLVSIPIIWQYIGYYMVIFISAFASIDAGVLEMAKIDGANAWQRAIYISLPLMKNTIIVAITLCISGNMKAFDHIYVMTGGGPGTATTVMAQYAYNTSFIRNNMGYGNAISIGILVLSLAVTLGVKALIGFLSKEKEAG